MPFLKSDDRSPNRGRRELPAASSPHGVKVYTEVRARIGDEPPEVVAWIEYDVSTSKPWAEGGLWERTAQALTEMSVMLSARVGSPEVPWPSALDIEADVTCSGEDLGRQQLRRVGVYTYEFQAQGRWRSVVKGRLGDYLDNVTELVLVPVAELDNLLQSWAPEARSAEMTAAIDQLTARLHDLED